MFYYISGHSGTQFKHRVGFSKAKELQNESIKQEVYSPAMRDIERPNVLTYLKTVLRRPLIKAYLLILFGIGCGVWYLFVKYLL